MTILAITAYTGSEKLVAMTEDMLQQFKACTWPEQRFRMCAVNNGASRPLNGEWNEITFNENRGFGKAINEAIAVHMGPEVTDILVLNNDLQFPHKDWLRKLVDARYGKFVLSPCTDRTAAKVAIAEGPVDKPPARVNHVSAFCWMVPAAVILSLRKRFGFHLFDPEFFAYGEDDYTGACLRHTYGKTPFLVVRRSWVKHLRNKTGAEVGLHGGMKKNLDLLRRKLKANRLR